MIPAIRCSHSANTSTTGFTGGAATALHKPYCIHIHDDLCPRNLARGSFGQHRSQEHVDLLPAWRFQNEVIAVVLLESQDRRRGRSKHAHSFVPRLLEPAPEFP